MLGISTRKPQEQYPSVINYSSFWMTPLSTVFFPYEVIRIPTSGLRVGYVDSSTYRFGLG